MINQVSVAIISIVFAYFPTLHAADVQLNPQILFEAKLRHAIKSRLNAELIGIDYGVKALHLKVRTPGWAGYVELDQFCDLLPSTNRDTFAIADCEQSELRVQGQWIPKAWPKDLNGINIGVNPATFFDEVSLKGTLTRALTPGDLIESITLEKNASPTVVFSASLNNGQREEWLACRLDSSRGDLQISDCFSRTGRFN